MAAQVRGFEAFKVFLEMVKIEHSIFALPFAMVGAMWASIDIGHGLVPPLDKLGWIVVAMVSCRSAAMAFNRIVDRHIDAKNPRTAARAIPAGVLSLRDAVLFFIIACAVFVLAAAMLNPLTLVLSPVALLFTLGYSMTKRFTWLCHFVLGMSLGIAPAAAYIGVSGLLSPGVVCIFGAVTLWTAGFDLIYALQDDEFDRKERLHSLPARFGRVPALWVSRICHLGASLLLLAGCYLEHRGVLALCGVLFAAGMLGYEQGLVKPNDLSKVNMAFFTLNGYVSMGFFIFALLDGLYRIPIPGVR